MKILGIGECMLELSQADGNLLRKSFAGDVMNTLFYASQAFAKDVQTKWHCGFFSAVGADPASEEMRAFIASVGIDVSTLGTVPDRRPGLYMIHLDGAERSFSYWRETSAAKLMFRDKAAAKAAFEKADALYFSGITLAILSHEDRAFFLRCMSAARKDGKMVAFDPNIRPSLWPDETKMRKAIADAGACASIVLPSFDDEHNAFGDENCQATIDRYDDYGSSLIVVKNGAGEISTKHPNGETQIYATDTVSNAVDTTGAGDSFNGAFLAEFLQSGDVKKAVSAGQKCAAKVISVYGALVPA